MVNRRSSIGLLLLACPYICLIILAWGFKKVDIQLLENAPIVLDFDGKNFPLNLGHVELQIILLSFALVFSNLIDELFGTLVALFANLGAALAVALCWGTLQLIPLIPGMNGAMSIESIYLTLFDFTKLHQLQMIAILAVGFNVVMLFSGMMRYLLKRGFSIIRLFVAHVLGLTIPALSVMALQYFPDLTMGPILSGAITLYVQWILLFFIFIPVYYVLFIPYVILVGTKQYEGGASKKTSTKSSKGIFTHETADQSEDKPLQSQESERTSQVSEPVNEDSSNKSDQ